MRSLFLFISLCLLSAPLMAQKRGELYGMVVIIDPGHGGSDPGSNGIFEKKFVNEDEYVYDVACRLWHMVRGHDGIAVMSVWDPDTKCGRRSPSPRDVLVSSMSEHFMLDKTRAKAGVSGLRKRVQFAQRTYGKYRKTHKVVFISIHFDATRNKGLQGVHFISPTSEPELIDLLQNEFESKKRLRRLGAAIYHPRTISGDKRNGVRNLYILRSHNPAKQKVLIELGNFRNENDLWRIRDHNVREDYARLILRALIRLNNLEMSKF